MLARKFERGIGPGERVRRLLKVEAAGVSLGVRRLQPVNQLLQKFFHTEAQGWLYSQKNWQQSKELLGDGNCAWRQTCKQQCDETEQRHQANGQPAQELRANKRPACSFLFNDLTVGCEDVHKPCDC